MKRIVGLGLAILTLAAGSGQEAAAKPQRRPKPAEKKATPDARAAYAEMKHMFGLVPGFFREFPTEAIAGAWDDYKAIELAPHSAIPPRYKELIGLAVAAQIPCSYCTYFHTRAAKADGATSREVTEAVAVASLTRKWSTVLNGMQIDRDQFRDETDRIVRYLESPKRVAGRAAPGKVVDAASAYRDIEATLGLVPTFAKQYPGSGIAGAWREMKALLFSETEIPAKYKDLICLAVSAQIPCDYCVYFDTAAAKLDGATPQEIAEAVAVASLTRQWSTFLNGMALDEATFQREVDQIFNRPKKRGTK